MDARTQSRTTKLLLAIATMFVALAGLSAAAGVQRAFADEADGAFTVGVVAQDGTFALRPTVVAYGADDSIMEALEAADLGFEFSSTGMVESVAGIAPSDGAYMYYFTNYYDDSLPGQTLDVVPAQRITSLFISAADVGALGNGHLRLLDTMGAYMQRTDGVRHYPDAMSAFTRGMEGLPLATDAQAQTLGDDFAAAIADYDGIMSGPKRTVTFRVTCGGSAVLDARATLTDMYGNEAQVVHVGAGAYEAQVPDLTYSYTVFSADGLDGVRCSVLSVSGDKTIDVQLPAEEWFDNANLLMRKNGDKVCPQEGSASDRKMPGFSGVRYIVPDAVQPITDLAVYAIPGEVPSAARPAYKFYTVYTGTDGKARAEYVAYEATSYCPPYLVDTNTQGADSSFEIRHEVAENTYQVEVCPATIVRSPTLSALSVTEGGTELLSGFTPYTLAYEVYTSAAEVTVGPEVPDPADDGYIVMVDGRVAEGPVQVETPAVGGTKVIPVVVSLNGHATEYDVTVHRVDAASVTMEHASGVTVEVVNDVGSVVAPASAGETATVYKLIDGRSYTYTATLDTYYHSRADFVAESGTAVSVAKPRKVDAIDHFALARGNTWDGSSAKLFASDESSTAHDARFIVPDKWASQSWLRAYPTLPASIDLYEYEAAYTRQDNGNPVKQPFTPILQYGQLEKWISDSLPNFTTASGYANTATFTVQTGTDGGTVFYEHYDVTAVRSLMLPAITASDGVNQLKLIRADGYDSAGNPLYNEDSPTYGYVDEHRDYVVPLAAGAESVRISFTFPTPVKDDAPTAGGYTVLLNGVETPYEQGATKWQDIAIDPESEIRDIKVPLTVRHVDPLTPDATYTITVRQMPKVSVQFTTSPSDASVTVTDKLTGDRVFAQEDGTFSLISGYTYSYTVAARGYVGVQVDDFVAAEGENPVVNLEPAPVNPTIDPTITADWPYFRADADNNGVVGARTPIDAEDTLLYWATQVGDGYSAGAAGCPIFVDGYLYTYAGDQLFKIDIISGDVVATGTMVGTSSFAITPMTYAEGMVFVALSNGRVEAFNAATLESLWVYTSPNGGQPNCPITYHDGCIYTGFWNWSNICDFVCLSVTDEDPTAPGSAIVPDPSRPGRVKSTVLDAKVPLWTYPHAGGFYWAGAWAGDNYVLVGSDDASITAGLDINDEYKASGTVFSLDPTTGEVIDTLRDDFGTNVGNIRSTIVRDADTGLFYWCGRAGYLCRAAVNADGTFDRSSLRAIRLLNNASDGAVSATSTPIIHNGRAYVGADHGSYNAYDGQCVDVVDLATSTVAYTIGMQGRAQSSGVLTTAYTGEDDGYAYLYFIDNYTPGKVRFFKDKPGQTRAVEAVQETYGNTTYDVAKTLFSPQRAQAQFCICSPIVDECGFIYLKNDSSYTMAIGPAIERLEVVEQPKVTVYGRGDTFNAAGMKVEAVYTNGTRRDVTNYVRWSNEKFTELGLTEVTIEFPYTMYKSPSSSTDIGTPPNYNFRKPTATIVVEVRGQVKPTLTTEKLPQAKAGEPYTAQLTASGYPREFTWACEGNLPSGIKFDAATGTFTGTPAQRTGGAYPIELRVTNSAGVSEKVPLTLEVREKARIVAPTSTKLAAAMTGQPYSSQFTAIGYPEPIIYCTQEGFVSSAGWTSHTPEGLAMDPDSGLLSGTPLEPGTFHLRVYAENEEGMHTPKAYTLEVGGDSLLPPEGMPSIKSVTLGTPVADTGEETFYIVKGTPVEFPIEVDGSPEPSVTVEGLPAGLAYNAEKRAIEGTPTRADAQGATVKIKVENEKGSDQRSYVLRVYEAPQIKTTELAEAKLRSDYRNSLTVTGAPAPHVRVTGLASGLRYDEESGIIYGKAAMAGTYSVNVTAANEAGTDTKRLTLVVSGAPAIAVTGLPEATMGVYYSVDLGITGYPVPAVNVAGLPAGLEYDEGSRRIQGTPLEAGESEVTVTASANGKEAKRTYTLVVADALVLLTEGLPLGIVGDGSYAAQLEFNKPADELTVNVAGLPSGLSFDKDALTITGTPEEEGVFNVVISAQTNDPQNLQTQTALELKILPEKAAVEMKERVALPPWKAGEARSASLADVLKPAGRPATYTWALADGSTLPEGVSLSEDGVLSGTPERTGAFLFDVTCSNGVGDPARATVTLNVAGQVTIEAPETIPAGIEGDAYRLELAVRGYPAATVSWEAADGSSLPAGLVIDRATGRISGTPRQPGTFTFIVTADNGISKKAQVRVQVLIRGNIANAQIEPIPNQMYTGSAISPALSITVPAGLAVANTLTLSGAPPEREAAPVGMATRKALVAGVDYTVEYQNSTNVGTAKAIVTGRGQYAGTNAVEFKVVPRSLASATVTGIVDKTYTGGALAQAPEVKVKVNDAKTLTLKEGADYKVAYKDNVDAGTATMTITGAGNFTGTKEAKFKIGALSLAKAAVTGVVAKTYTGKAITQKPTVKLNVGAKTVVLREGADYKVAYKNNVKAGKATMTIAGAGNFTGTASRNFTINKAANPFKAKTKAATVSYNKRKATSIAVSKYLKVTYNKSKGKVTYKKKSGDKKIKVAKNGKLTVAKGTKRGSHKIVVAVTTAAKGSYKATTKQVKVTIKVK